MAPGPEGWSEDAEDDDQDSCTAADDIGSGASQLHGTDGLPGDSADAEEGGDLEQVLW